MREPEGLLIMEPDRQGIQRLTCPQHAAQRQLVEGVIATQLPYYGPYESESQGQPLSAPLPDESQARQPDYSETGERTLGLLEFAAFDHDSVFATTRKRGPETLPWNATSIGMPDGLRRPTLVLPAAILDAGRRLKDR
jgi:hypothetical protein